MLIMSSSAVLNGVLVRYRLCWFRPIHMIVKYSTLPLECLNTWPTQSFSLVHEAVGDVLYNNGDFKKF